MCVCMCVLGLTDVITRRRPVVCRRCPAPYCCRCAKPYFGGARACGAQAEDGEDGGGGGHRADELVCGDCCAQAAGTNCAKHGTAYIEWKCKWVGRSGKRTGALHGIGATSRVA